MSSTTEPTRTRILDATSQLLEETHGAAVRMSDVAKAAGLSRQALYLHFPSRAALFIATVRHLDAVHDVDARLVASRRAPTGTARLDAFVEAWLDYVPVIHGVARTLMLMRETDADARAAWDDRMAALRHGCRAAVDALAADAALTPHHTPDEATDLLLTVLSMTNWEMLRGCDWPQSRIVETFQMLARNALVTDAPRAKRQPTLPSRRG